MIANPNEITGFPQKLRDDIAVEPKPKNTLGKDDFMKLLLAEIKNQDPLKPMGHQEFATQLAQFGQLEQLNNIGTGINSLKTGMGDDAKLQAIGMIGKKIEASASEVELIQGQSVVLNAKLPENVKPVKATILDSTGKVVRELNLAVSSKDIQWDGKDQEGISLPSGKYLFRVHGVGPNGEAKEAGSELSGRVIGVEMEGSEPKLVVQNGSGQTKVALVKVRKVMEQELSHVPDPTKTQVQNQVPKQVASQPQADETQPMEFSRSRDPHGIFLEGPMEARIR